MKKVITIALVVVFAVAAASGIYAVVSKPDTPTTTTSVSQNDTPAESETSTTEPPTTTDEVAEEVIITYSDTGYSPAIVTVKTGGKVTVKNTTSHAMQFDSDPHPAHTDNRELNADNIAPGKSESFTVVKTGTFGYHNHLNESETGTIIVQ